MLRGHVYKLTVGVVLLSFILLTVSCATSPKTQWVDPDYDGGPVRKIVVIGMFRNLASRTAFEREIVDLINARSGTRAVSSLEFMAPNTKYEYAAMESRFREMGIDGILIIRTRSIDNTAEFIPGATYTVREAVPYYQYQNPYYYRYYVYTYTTIREPGYYMHTAIVSTESTLFLNGNDRMIWTMEMNTTQKYRTIDGITNPGHEAPLSATAILNGLRKNRLLLPRG